MRNILWVGMISSRASLCTRCGWSRVRRCDTRATVVAHHIKGLKTQLLHDFDLVLRHGPFGIREVLWVPVRLAAVP